MKVGPRSGTSCSRSGTTVARASRSGKSTARLRSRTVIQLSLLELERLRNPSASDARHVARIAADVIAELAEEPPISLEVVASYRGIRDIRLEDDLPVAGSLTPQRGQMVMRLLARDVPARRRFTGFHEVGHTFQPGYTDAPSFRCETISRARARRADGEHLADVASVELMLPRSFFVDEACGLPFGLGSVTTLAERYEASIEATALRYVELRAKPSLLVVLAPGVRRAERGDPAAEPRLRVRYISAQGAWPFVPQNKSAREGGGRCTGRSSESTLTRWAHSRTSRSTALPWMSLHASFSTGIARV